MSTYSSDQIQSWLDLLCQMVPGIGQAALVRNAPGDEPVIRWPNTESTHDDVMMAANLASNQGKLVTTTLSAATDTGAAVDTIIAIPLKRFEAVKGALAVRVNINPSQQSTTIHMLRWGEKWLGLLPRLGSSEVTEPAHKFPSLAGVGEKSISRRGVSMCLVLGALFMALVFASGTYRVTGTASLEGEIQRAVVAPFDGYVAVAHARAGNTVVAGELIAELDTQDLMLEQQKFAAEINEYDHQYRQALMERNNAQAHIFKSRMGQAQAQFNLTKEKIKRSRLVSSLNGVIISGDLSRSLGAPVKTGDVLFEVAPLDKYRLIVLVDEKQVVDVTDGLKGALTLKSMPDEKLSFVVEKVSPVFTSDGQGSTYRVEARLIDRPEGLRPGMEGVAKIDIEKRRFGWIFFHELVDVLKLWAWRWLP
ncbi:MAG: efflux RND transporter periplasmic adaptor subunit [Granulosicoccus sp.]